MVASKDNFPLLAELLAAQQQLDTPVAQFAGAHAAGALAANQARHSALIPLSVPGPGEQYAFQVDLDSCTGCKACVAACHSLNGLDETETWRDVGLLVADDPLHPFQQTVTTACHHCADPGCLNGCPVLAYEKDPVTGIVRHLDDQCIGCQYCVLKCPYDVPKYNARLGIVRKCDMCHSRLAAGEAPACAQACPTHAITIITVAVPTTPNSELRTLNSGRNPAPGFLPGAPDPALTQPTTRYVSRRPLPPGLRAADAAHLRPQPAHWPLVFMLTLLPLAVGLLTAAFWGDATAYVTPLQIPALVAAGWLAGALGLGASVFHLCQPLRAWRIFLGWRKSWLSREAMAFGAWFALVSAALLRPALAPLAAGVGLASLACSAMIYVDTGRHFWRATQTFPRFLGTAAVLGAAGALALGHASRLAAFALILATLAKLALELRTVRPASDLDPDAPLSPALATARLHTGPFRAVFGLRIAGALSGGVFLPLALAAGALPTGWGVVAFGLALAGETAERYLFFRAVDAPKMPGHAA